MKSFLSKNLLLVSVFITGACVLIVEVVAVRVLSPHYGQTIFTVSSVITVILLALSVGYYTGGKLADRYPSPQWFYGIILISGLLIFIFHLLGLVVLPILSVMFSLFFGPLISSTILFLLPALLLGTLSPYAIKLQSMQFPQQGIGSISGKIFFWSTCGSITGSLLAGFVFIPRFGIDKIFMGTGTVLFVLGFLSLSVLHVKKGRLLSALIAYIILNLTVSSVIQLLRPDAVYYKDGVYEKITIYDAKYNGRPVRFFRQDKSDSGGTYLDSDDPTELTHKYSRYYAIYEIFRQKIDNVLIIGGGAYSLPKVYLSVLPQATVDVSEIEPSLVDLAKQYLGLRENPRMHNFDEDGRRFLRDSTKQYDIIFSDAYYSLFSIPAHLTTREFFTLAKSRLTDEGILIANIIGTLPVEKSYLLSTEIKTFQSVFPNSYFFAVESPDFTKAQNIIFIGYNSEKQLNLEDQAIVQNPNPIISQLAQKRVNVENIDLSAYPILTDNYAPVEYLTARALRDSY